MENNKKVVLELLSEEYSVYKFGINHQMNKNIFDNEFVSITKTNDELSIVAISGLLNQFEKKEDNWKVLKIIGILDFSLIGIISTISSILANNGISIFVISTYNTDYIMVKVEKITKTIEILKKNNFEIKNNIFEDKSYN